MQALALQILTNTVKILASIKWKALELAVFA
jgi:hypothetical protein